MVWNFRRKLAYNQEEVAEQIGQISDLMRMRKSTQITDEAQQFTDAIAISQEVLHFMLDENSSRLVRKSVV